MRAEPGGQDPREKRHPPAPPDRVLQEKVAGEEFLGTALAQAKSTR